MMLRYKIILTQEDDGSGYLSSVRVLIDMLPTLTCVAAAVATTLDDAMLAAEATVAKLKQEFVMEELL